MALTRELYARDLDPNAYMVGILEVSGADKANDPNKYIITINTNVYLHWIQVYGASTLVLSGTDFPSTAIVSNYGITPISGIDNYADRSGWLNGGVFTKEIDKASSQQELTFTLSFSNTRTDPSSGDVSVSITVPKREATAHVNVNGVWKDATLYVNVNGAWKEAVPYVNVNGTWKEGV